MSDKEYADAMIDHILDHMERMPPDKRREFCYHINEKAGYPVIDAETIRRWCDGPQQEGGKQNGV